MGQLMLINPRKRRTARKASPKRRVRRVHRNPVARVVASKRRVRRNPIATRKMRSSRRIRRNPIGGGGIGAQVMSAAIGGVGAVAVDVIQGYIPLPVSMQTGYMPYVVKGALGFMLGTFGKKILGQNAVKMGAGAMTVAAYGALKQMTSGMLPGTVAAGSVAGLGYMSPTPQIMAGMGEYVTGPGSRMGEYISGNSGFGYQ